ncbi:MAG: hypothetical protein R3E12_14915 [Candidatus Eisenbacteria bacterium]
MLFQQPSALGLLLVEDDEDDYVITRDLLDDLAAGQYELDWAAHGGRGASLSRQGCTTISSHGLSTGRR